MYSRTNIGATKQNLAENSSRKKSSSLVIALPAVPVLQQITTPGIKGAMLANNDAKLKDKKEPGPFTGVVQKLGTNVTMVDEEERHFDTAKGKSRLRVDPDADAYLEDHFEKDSASKLTNASLGDKFSHAMNRVYKGIPYNKEKKIEAFASNVQPTGKDTSRKERGLGYILHTESATCWEKAAHFHLILAELGIPTYLEGGFHKVSGTGHAWLLIPPNAELLKGKKIIIDPTIGEIMARSDYEEKYNITIPPKQVALPKKMESPSAIETALKDFVALEKLGGIVKKAVLETIDLKIDRVMQDKRREKETAEWDKLILKFKESLK